MLPRVNARDQPVCVQFPYNRYPGSSFKKMAEMSVFHENGLKVADFLTRVGVFGQEIGYFDQKNLQFRVIDQKNLQFRVFGVY